jgi:hypothetical protein
MNKIDVQKLQHLTSAQYDNYDQVAARVLHDFKARPGFALCEICGKVQDHFYHDVAELVRLSFLDSGKNMKKGILCL